MSKYTIHFYITILYNVDNEDVAIRRFFYFRFVWRAK